VNKDLYKLANRKSRSLRATYWTMTAVNKNTRPPTTIIYSEETSRCFTVSNASHSKLRVVLTMSLACQSRK